MKKTIFCILLILMFFVAKDNSIFAQNKVKIGSISLSDTIIGGLHYLKINAGIRPITIFNESDTNRIGDIILKDSLGNLVIGANTIINGNLSFRNTILTLSELLTRGVRFSDSLVIRTTIEDVIDYNLYILDDHHTSSIITNLSGVNEANKFEITMGNINNPDSYFRMSRSGDIYLGGARVYIDSVAFDVSTVLLNNANNTFSGTNTFNGYSAFNNTVELTKGLYIASALIPDTLSLYGTFLLDGVDINNGGLTNVAYKNDNNTFDSTQTFDTINATGDIKINGNSVRPYKVYTALLTQEGTDAPVATVLENTIGTITYSYSSAGDYSITSDGLFNENKTFILPVYGRETTNGGEIDILYNDSNTIRIETSKNGNGENDLLVNFPIEIRVYY